MGALASPNPPLLVAGVMADRAVQGLLAASQFAGYQERMFKITGLDKLQKQLKEAGEAFAEIDGNIGQVSFDPTDPASIEAAIKDVERMIDQRVGSYSDNPIVAPAIEGMKEKYRAAIIEKAAVSRLKSENE